jgi:enamine deaminase RidA (YjgF/YER057c/UK114 family)
MPAYYRATIKRFLNDTDDAVLARLATAYANDGYVSQYTSATLAWANLLPMLRSELRAMIEASDGLGHEWVLLLEYPLYRLRRRIDAVLLGAGLAIVVEVKSGTAQFTAADRRQAIEYAQDLRDFHGLSRNLALLPVLWCVDAVHAQSTPRFPKEAAAGVWELLLAGTSGLREYLSSYLLPAAFNDSDTADVSGSAWDRAAYNPVPSVIDAAVTLFAGHGVREITTAGATNLVEAAEAVFEAISIAREQSRNLVVLLTGVPGSGKTLAGLNVVHTAVERGLAEQGDAVYLSGNTPLVIVLREALAQDQHAQRQRAGEKARLGDIRSQTRATIQHVNDFLKEYVHHPGSVPSGHVVVFDEAQRAWDARQGTEKFGREHSEPYLVLEAMARLPSWSVTVCLLGLGQEINDGEEGLSGWIEALERLSAEGKGKWSLMAPGQVMGGTRGPRSVGTLPAPIRTLTHSSLHLDVPVRSFRSPLLGEWITALIREGLHNPRASLLPQGLSG